MYSIIICSISKEMLSKTAENINNTIGEEYEIIAIDNNICKYSITQAYNEGAKKARFPYLLFLHEDVRFHTNNWGSYIKEKLKEKDCGTIGFAGSKQLLNIYYGWWQNEDWCCQFMFQGQKSGETYLQARDVTLERPFVEVAVLDGLALFVRKNVWEQFPFDEINLTGFHCYDIDFTLRIAASKKYKNYVCTSLHQPIEHLSEGNLNIGWISDIIKMHRTKWKTLLPICVENFNVNIKENRKTRERCFHKFVKLLVQTNYPERWAILKEFITYDYTWKHIRHCISDTFLYLTYKSRY